jgi:two-component system, OmpR family, phosphate regulon sensor histidine kinase PhoR
LGIRSKLFLVSVGLIAASVVAGDLYLRPALEKLLTDRIRDDLLVRARLVAHDARRRTRSGGAGGAGELAAELAGLARVRVSLIGPDGFVRGDSEVDALGPLENHSHRPEVAEALAGREGSDIRYSTTLRQRLMYVAVPVAGGELRVARLAMHLSHVERVVAQLRGLLLWATVVALAVAVLMSTGAAQLVSRGVRRMTQSALRMARGDLEHRIAASGRDEIASLGRALDDLAASLSQSLGALRGERDRLDRVLSGMEEGVIVVGPDGVIVLVNPALREMLLLDGAVVGQPLREQLRHPELHALLEAAARPGGDARSAEIDLAGLRPRRVLVHAAHLRGEEGGVLAVLVDVTSLRKLESLRRDFVANVSHELRTPIAAARSAAETLHGRARDPETTIGFVEIIERNLERLQQLVEDLLDLSRIESRELTLNPEPCELEALVDRVLALHRERAGRKKIDLAADRLGRLTITADRRALEQVLSNLVDNAVKYCSEGASVRVGAAVQGAALRITVADTGPGIAAEHLPRLFERFYRIDAGRSRELGGTGLGLAIVKHLVEAMRGRVEVESEVGRGSRFSFTLPDAAGDGPGTPLQHP